MVDVLKLKEHIRHNAIVNKVACTLVRAKYFLKISASPLKNSCVRPCANLLVSAAKEQMTKYLPALMKKSVYAFYVHKLKKNRKSYDIM